jgi:hypothetical protein
MIRHFGFATRVFAAFDKEVLTGPVDCIVPVELVAMSFEGDVGSLECGRLAPKVID